MGPVFRPEMRWNKLHRLTRGDVCRKLETVSTGRLFRMRRHSAFRLARISGIALLALLPGMAAAEVSVRKTVTYFDIRGASAAELDRELSRRGPKTMKTGMRHPGATRIKFGGTVTYADVGHACRIDTVKVTVSTQLILPRWKKPKRHDKGLPLIWNTLAADIKRHEERHAEIARNHARHMEKLFSRLPPQRTCDAMQARVGEASRLALEEHDLEQARFDSIEAANFESRMTRLMHHRLSSRHALD